MAADKNESTDASGEWTDEMLYVHRMVMTRFDQLDQRIFRVAELTNRCRQILLTNLETSCDFPTVPLQDDNTPPDLEAFGDFPTVSLKDGFAQTDTIPVLEAIGDLPTASHQDVNTQTETPDLEAMGDSTPPLVADSSVQTNKTVFETKECSASVELQDAETQSETSYCQRIGAAIIDESKVPIIGTIQPPKWTSFNIPCPIWPLSLFLSDPKAMEMPERQGLKVEKDLEEEEVDLGLPVIIPEVTEVLDVPMKPIAIQGLPLVPKLGEALDVPELAPALDLPELGAASSGTDLGAALDVTEVSAVLDGPNEVELPVLLDVQKLPEVPEVINQVPVGNQVSDVDNELKIMQLLLEMQEAHPTPKDLKAMELPVLLDVPELFEVPVPSEFLDLPEPELPNLLDASDVLNEPKAQEEEFNEEPKLPVVPIIAVVPTPRIVHEISVVTDSKSAECLQSCDNFEVTSMDKVGYSRISHCF